MIVRIHMFLHGYNGLLSGSFNVSKAYKNGYEASPYNEDPHQHSR